MSNKARLACLGFAAAAYFAVAACAQPRLPGFTVLESRSQDGITESLVSYSSDGLKVRAYVYTQEPAEARPLAVFNHGGVSGVSNDMRRRSRDLVNAGFTVITPEYRGEGESEGQIEVAHGEVDDVITATRLMMDSRYVDAERTAILGSSHGALISVLAAAKEPGLYNCVVAACGVMDVEVWYLWLVENKFDVSDSLTVAIYGRGPEDRPEAFAVRRAVPRASQLKAPLLLQYGVLDRIVPMEQGKAMAGAADQYIPVTLSTFPLLGHAFWFWDDLSRHTVEDVRQADQSWAEAIEFMRRFTQQP